MTVIGINIGLENPKQGTQDISALASIRDRAEVLLAKSAYATAFEFRGLGPRVEGFRV